MSTILITGASGYIGGTVYRTVLSRYQPSNITVFIRSQAQASLFEADGVNIRVAGKDAEADLLKAARAHDVVIHEAGAGNIPWIKAIIAGLEKRALDSHPRKKPILLHGGGAAVIMDQALGTYNSSKPYSDLDDKALASIPDSARHRDGDLLITEAAKAGKIDAYHLSPPFIYGRGTGPGHNISIQFPMLLQESKRQGHAVFVGEGKNVWNGIHVQDLADAFVFLLQRALEKPLPPLKTGWETFHFVSAEEVAFGDLARKAGDYLHSIGKADQPGAVSIEPRPELLFISNNSKCTSDRLAQLGWRPKQRTALETAVDDTKHWLELNP